MQEQPRRYFSLRYRRLCLCLCLRPCLRGMGEYHTKIQSQAGSLSARSTHTAQQCQVKRASTGARRDGVLGEVRGVRTRTPLREGMAGKGSTCHQKHGDDDKAKDENPVAY